MSKSRKQIDNDVRVPGLEKAFAGVLREHRRAKGLTQEELALRTDLDRAYISRMERGIQRPSLTTIFLLAKELGLTAWELIRTLEEKMARE